MVSPQLFLQKTCRCKNIYRNWFPSRCIFFHFWHLSTISESCKFWSFLAVSTDRSEKRSCRLVSRISRIQWSTRKPVRDCNRCSPILPLKIRKMRVALYVKQKTWPWIFILYHLSQKLECLIRNRAVFCHRLRRSLSDLSKISSK